MSAGVLAILLLALAAVDNRVREQIWLRFSARPAVELANVGERARDLATIVVQAARDQSIEHAPLLIFVLAATVLVLFMLRT